MLYSAQFLAMAFANVFVVSSFGSFFLFPLFIRHHGGSESDIGIVMGAMVLASVLSRPWISEMVDRIGRKRSFTTGSVIMSCVPLIYLLFRGDLDGFYPSLLLVRVLHGVGLAFWFTGAMTYIADIIPEGRLNEGIGMFGVSGLTGLSVGPVIAEALINRFDFSALFLASSAMALTGTLLHLPLSDPYDRSPHMGGPSFFSVLKRRRTSTAALLALFFGVGLAAVGSFVTPFANEKGLSFVSLYFICYSSAAICTRVFGGRIADRIGEERVIPYALALTGLGLFGIIFLGGNSILILSGILTGSGHGFLFPSLNALAIRNEKVDIKGKINGVFSGGIDTGAFLGSIMLGYIANWVGFHALFFVAGLALFMGLGVFAWRWDIIASQSSQAIGDQVR